LTVTPFFFFSIVLVIIVILLMCSSLLFFLSIFVVCYSSLLLSLTYFNPSDSNIVYQGSAAPSDGEVDFNINMHIHVKWEKSSTP
jgi:hypothetical protein